jgi:hypothetical protein
MQSIDSESELLQVTKRILTLHITNPVSKNPTEIHADTDNSIQEHWKEVGSEYPGYSISNVGRMQGLKGKIFGDKTNRYGYVRYNIINSTGQRVNRYAHILVATTLIPNPEDKPVINHKNGIRHDNRVVNLEWTTYRENAGPMKLNQIRGDCRRRVIQYSINGQLIKIWDSLTDTGDDHPGRISEACRTKTVYRGHHWRYYDEIVSVENEVWKSIVCNGVTVEASNLGRIRRKQGKIVGSDMPGQYIRINLNGSIVLAHRLICMAWKPIPNPEMYVVNHIDNNGKNNHIENLEWATQSENRIHYCTNYLVRGSSSRCRPVKQLSVDDRIVIT